MSTQITPGPWSWRPMPLKFADDQHPEPYAIIQTQNGAMDLSGPNCMMEELHGNAQVVSCIPPILEYLRLRAADGDETAALLLLKAGQ